MIPSSGTPFPTALPPPPGPVTVMSSQWLAQALRTSRQSPRRRVILPLHKGHSAPLQRMFNAVQPGSYLRPHRHATPPKAENLLVWQGTVAFFEFADNGQVRRRIILRADGPDFGVDLEPGIFHTFVALEPDTVLFETKPGPYAAIHDKDFPSWAPPEGSPETAGYLEHLYQLARVGQDDAPMGGLP